ncbi:unnamed protein product [Anisakis simplex]|uniref:Uncharacterized protein n=1 Tax=Anisakis simplex TaxID=6269 RepID=A0A0M3J5S5_ANISI|nr:unnamed protein product [Anisakis simplex]
MSSDEQRTDSETTKRTTGSIDRLKASNIKSNKSKSSDHRQNKLAKVGKQEGIDEDEQEEETERNGDSNEENKCENASGSNQKIESNVEIINVTVERQQTVQHQSSEVCLI